MSSSSFSTFLLALLLTACTGHSGSQLPPAEGGLWLTTPDQKSLFEPQASFGALPEGPVNPAVIAVNPAQTFQAIDGFGYTLTGGSALHLHRMTPEARSALLREMFGTGEGQIGVSYLRVSIGASDLDERPFSYDDLPAGQTDPELRQFSLAPDEEHLIPVLREILAIYPDLKIMGSPWSAPAWMKDNNETRGGSLRPEFYGAYGQYFVQYIQGMAAAGIRIDAVTVQNEPLHPGNNPSMFMPAEAQAEFIKNHLGPAFAAAGIQTKIILYDHNADRPDYPLTILADSAAARYVDGSAFHLYGGKIDTLTTVHETHPDKHLYFTEQWIGAPGDFPNDFKWHIRELIIGATRNWCRTVLEWNLANDPNQQPHTDRGGCDRCLGAVTIEGDQVTRNPAYYIIAHAAKFVRPGSVRIASNLPENLPNVAFLTPDNRIALIVLNNGATPQSFAVQWEGKTIQASLVSGAAGTFVLEREK